MTYRCHYCGRFLSGVEAMIDADHNIKRVEGHCAKHGKMPVSGWVWEDFFPEPHAPKLNGEDR